MVLRLSNIRTAALRAQETQRKNARTKKEKQPQGICGSWYALHSSLCVYASNHFWGNNSRSGATSHNPSTHCQCMRRRHCRYAAAAADVCLSVVWNLWFSWRVFSARGSLARPLLRCCALQLSKGKSAVLCEITHTHAGCCCCYRDDVRASRIFTVYVYILMFRIRLLCLRGVAAARFIRMLAAREDWEVLIIFCQSN